MSTLVTRKVWIISHEDLGRFPYIISGYLPDIVHQVFSSHLANVHLLDALSNNEDWVRQAGRDFDSLRIVNDALELPTEREVLERLEVDSLCEEGLIWFLLEAWGFDYYECYPAFAD